MSREVLIVENFSDVCPSWHRGSLLTLQPLLLCKCAKMHLQWFILRTRNLCLGILSLTLSPRSWMCQSFPIPNGSLSSNRRRPLLWNLAYLRPPQNTRRSTFCTSIVPSKVVTTKIWKVMRSLVPTWILLLQNQVQVLWRMQI